MHLVSKKHLDDVLTVTVASDEEAAVNPGPSNEPVTDRTRETRSDTVTAAREMCCGAVD